MQRVLLIDDDEWLAPPLATYPARFEFKLHSATRPSSGATGPAIRALPRLV